MSKKPTYQELEKQVQKLEQSLLDAKNSEAKPGEIQSVLDSMLNAFVIFDSVFDENGKFISYRFVYINKAYEKITGVKNEAVKGKTVHEVWPGTEASWVEKYGYVATTGETLIFDNYHEPTQKLYHCRVYRPDDTPERFCVIFDDITEQKNQENSLVKSENLLSKAEKISNQGSWKWDIVNDKYSFSDNWLRIHGFDHSGITRKELMSIAHPDDVSKIDKAFEDALAKRKPYSLEHRIVRKDNGMVRTIKSSGEVYFTENGKPDFMIGVAQDITESRAIQDALRQSEERLNLIIKGSNDAPWDWDFANKEMYYSPQWWAQIGYEPDELPGTDQLWYELTHPEDREVIDATLNKALKSDMENFQLEFRLKHKDGHYVPVLSRGIIIRDDGGNLIRISGTNQDLTERKQVEQELIKAREQAENNEKELSKVQKLTHIGSWYLDIATNQVTWTEELYKMYGFDPALPVPPYTEHMKLFTPESWNILSSSLENTRKTGIAYEHELKTIKKDGSNGWMWVRGEAIQNKEGETTALWGAAQDITERKQTEDELRKAKERAEKNAIELKKQQVLFETMFNTIKEGVVVTNTEREIVLANNGMLTTFGYNPKEIIGKQTQIFYADTDKFEKAGKNVFNKDAKESDNQYITYYKHKNNKIFPGETFGSKLYNEQGEWIGNIGIMRDVSEREKFIKDLRIAKEKAEKSEERLKTILDTSPFPTAVVDVNDENILYWSKSAIQLFGHHPKTTEEWYELAYPDPDYRQEVITRWKPILDEIQHSVEAVNTGEYQIVCKDGSIKICELYAQFIPGNLIVSMNDITDRKQAEEKLLENQNRYKKAQRMGHVGNWEYDPVTTKFWGSDEAKRIYGFELENEEFTSETVESCIVERERVHQALIDLIEHDKEYNLVFDIISYDKGIRKTIHSIAELERDTQGNPKKITGVFSDVTESKQAEKTLKESEERFRQIWEQSTDALALSDAEGIVQAVNPAYVKLYGYSSEQLIGESFSIIFPEEIRKSSVDQYKSIFNSNNLPDSFESIVKRADGSERIVESSATYLMNNGQRIAMISRIHDITERKQAEAELKKIEWLLQPKQEKSEGSSQGYGDLTELNRERTILDSVGKDLLYEIVSDYLVLLDTSAAVYEKNGDYAFGIFSSDWCQFMDCSSRALCKSKDNKIALESGKWLCHESCWGDASKQSIQTEKPVDIECSGGLHLYTIPIKANNKVIGSINFGYGNPPTDEDKLTEIATKYKVSYDKLKDLAQSYETRPAFIIDIAKEKLASSARLIGEIVERKFAEEALGESEEKFRSLFENINAGVALHEIIVDEHGKPVDFVYLDANSQYEKITTLRKEDIIGKRGFEVIPNLEQKWIDLYGEVALTGKAVSIVDHSDFLDKYWDVKAYSPAKNQFAVALMDITDQKIAEIDLAISEERYRTLLETVQAGIGYYNLEGTSILFNQTAATLMGSKPEDLIGKSMVELFGKENGQKYFDRITKAAKAQDYLEFIDEIDLPTGKLWFSSKYSKIHDSKGKVVGIQIISVDITELKLSENKLQKLFDNMNSAFAYHQIILDDAGKPINYKFVEVNKAFELMIGLKSKDIIGKNVTELIPGTKNDPANWIGVYGEVALTGKPKQFQNFSKELGKWFDVSVYSPQPGFFATIFNDITDQKIATEEIETLWEVSPDMICVADYITANFLRINPAFIKTLGYEEFELLNQSFLEFVHPDDVQPTIDVIDKKLKVGKHVFDFTNRYRCKDGSYKYLDWVSHSIEEKGLTYAIARDVTTQIEAEEKIIKAKETAERYLDMAGSMFVSLDINGDIELVNQKALEILEYDSSEELIGKNWFDTCIPQEINSEITKAFKKISIGEMEGVEHYENEVVTKSGDRKIIFWHNSYIRNESDKTQYVLSSGIDVTEIRKANLKLKKSEAQYKNLVETASDAIYLMADSGMIIDTNQCACDMLRKTKNEIIGSMIDTVDPNFSIDEFLKYWENIPFNEQNVLETSHLRKDGTLIPIEISGKKFKQNEEIFFYGIARDITDRKKAEEEIEKTKKQLQQAQKMEAIGTLAGGIAHDFNNLLTVIIGYTALALKDITPGSELNEDLEEVLTASNRAKDLVKQILAYSRQNQVERSSLQLQPLVKEALKLLRSSIPTTISITEDIDPNSKKIMADPTQIHQIMVNLCTNAYHAMETTGGTISVSLHTTFISPDDRKMLFHLKPGEYVELTVSDNGKGISPDVIDKIFDPYFTTKEVGKGTGMGLAIIHGIVNEYGGTITVESELGKGTTFHVFFPVAQTDAESDKKEQDEMPVGTERILLVDDEKNLLKMGQRMLESIGYHVTALNSSVDALATFEKTPMDFDLVISDQTMPDITGSELAGRMMRIRPDIPIILLTGYSNLIDEDSAKNLGIKGFALKPFTQSEIAELIRKVLDKVE